MHEKDLLDNLFNDEVNVNPVRFPREGFLRVSKMKELLGLGVSTIWAMARNDPKFPKPIKLTPHITVWRADEVFAWIESQEHVTYTGPSSSYPRYANDNK